VIASRAAYDGAAGPPPNTDQPGVHVRRLAAPGVAMSRSLPSRLMGEGLFLSALCAAALRGPRPDLVLCLTTPPFLGLVGRAAANLRGAVHAHWVMDVYPDALAAQGWIGRGGIVFRTLRFLARLQLRGAAAVIALGEGQKARLEPYVEAPPAVVPLWSAVPGPAADEDAARARAAQGWEAADTVFLYAGNMGRGHRLDDFLEAARRLGAGGPRWAFTGGGARAEEVAACARREPQARVQLRPYVPRADLPALLAAGDVHLASVRDEWSGLIVPSKVQAAFAAGRPVLFVGRADGDPGAWVEESGGGWRIDAGDVDGLLRAVEAALDAAERARRGAAALAYAAAHFDRERNGAQLAALLEAAADTTGPARSRIST